MKLCCSLFILLFSVAVYAQDKTPVHGEVFGKKPGKTAMVNAEKLEAYMDTKPRISTTIKGKVVNVVKEKGGWFTPPLRSRVFSSSRTAAPWESFSAAW